MFSHKSAGPSSRCNRNIFEDDKSLGSFQLLRKCLWPRYHADLLKMESQKTLMGSEVKHTHIGTVRQTRPHSVDSQVSAADGIGKVKERLPALTWRLHNDLANEVFDACTKEVIENCRVICDLNSLLENIYQKGSVMVGLGEAKTFLNVVRNIT